MTHSDQGRQGDMLTVGLLVLLATLVWQLVRILQAKRQPTIDFVLVYALGVILLIIGSIFAYQVQHPGLGFSSFIASGACLFSLLRQGSSSGGGFAA